MLANTTGSFRLFRAFGIDVFVHWSWFVVAYIQYLFLDGANVAFHFAVYLSLFGIVLLHEFGHALACRSVGGRAEKIVLWPLGGVAYVQPPQRPGAVLWSIAAGPLVNVVLVPVAVALVVLTGFTLDPASPVPAYFSALLVINTLLLLFNLLPIYPLDGGQIVWSLLWFFVGRTKSLLWSAWFGLFCAIVIGGVMIALRDWWLVVMAVFIGMQSWRGITIARAMAYYEQQERAGNVLDPWQR